MIKRRILSIKEQFAALFIDVELECGHAIPMTRGATINGSNLGVEYQAGEISCVYCHEGGKVECNCQYGKAFVGHRHATICPLNTTRFANLTPEDMDEI